MEDSRVETEARRKEPKKDDLGGKIVYPKPNITKKLNGRWGYQCERCGQVLYSEKFLTRHMANHTDEDANSDKEQEDEVEEQEVVVSTPVCSKKPSSHSCIFCSKSFWTNSNLEDHIRIHTNEKPFGCPHPNCEKTFTSHQGAQRHQLSHSNETPNKCSKCELSFKTVKTLNKHKKRKHPKNNSFPQHACHLCLAVFWEKIPLKRHLKTHMDPLYRPSFQCPECEISFTTNENMQQHMKCYHSKDKPVYKCSYCRRNFFSEDDLREHKQKMGHDKEKQFSCAVCDVKFTCQKTLKKHLKTERHRIVEETHKVAEKLVEKCEEVQQVFAKDNFVLVPSICCKSCASTFSSEQKLAQHVNNVHYVSPEEEDNPFRCERDGCHKTFKRKDNMKLHVERVHLNLGKYPCSRCGKKFNQYRDLKTHNDRHPDCDIFIRDEQSKHRKDESERGKLISPRIELVDLVDSLGICGTPSSFVLPPIQNREKTREERFRRNKMRRVEEQQLVSEVGVDSSDDEVPTRAEIYTLEQVVQVINSDDESSPTQQPERVTITLNTPEFQQQQPVPALAVLQEQYAGTESPGVTQMGREHHLNNDPAPSPVNIQQTQNVDDTSNTGREESVKVSEITKQEAVENGVLSLGIQIQMEDEFRADAETAEELISQLVANINTMEAEESFTNELDNREEPEGAATATQGTSTDAGFPVSKNGAGKEPEQPASPPLLQLPTEPRTETGVVQATPSNERNESVAVAGTSKSGLSEDQPANKGRSMNLRKRDSSGKTAPPPPKRRYLPKQTTTQDESEDEETKAKREEESLKFFQLPRAENGFRIIPRCAIQVNPYLRKIKTEPDLPGGIKVEVESVEMSAD